MLTLAIETATVNCSVALLHGDRVLAEESLAVPRVHSVVLMPMIAQLYQRVCAIPQETDLVAVSCGPGSFTGLRIGIATAKGLAYAWNKPCVAVGTLDGLAMQGGGLRSVRTVLAVLKARQGELYYCLFRPSSGIPQKIGEVSAGYPEDIAEAVHEAAVREAPVLLVGDVDLAEGETLVEVLAGRGIPCAVAPAWLRRPRAAIIGILGRLLAENGLKTDAARLSAAYVRKSEAEIKWEKSRPASRK
ncbi:MAG TPA: tRNA (adenosine(37)-N6)-threonylcarbamoyltransferase complex dimerization subunit type 1 TsaB [Firmicutes bacterium]|nr:tRNA (adenosine(37)-N6)-threonylcarbamoyltransferase complex dimerization subunit type 1 TsaB [Bacillota bacterium]